MITNKISYFLFFILIINFNSVYGKCLSSSNEYPTCRLEAGDMWCVENGKGNSYAYSDKCLKAQALPTNAKNTESISSNENKKQTRKEGIDIKERFGVPEEIPYDKFYAKAKTGMKPLQPYRFNACLSQSPCLKSMDSKKDQVICGLDIDRQMFENPSELIGWLESGEKYCGYVTAIMLLTSKITIIALH